MLPLKRTLSLLALAAVALTLSACAGNRVLTAERPKDAAFRTELKKEMSTLNVAIEASSDDLARTLNRLVANQLYKGSTSTRGLSADISRNGAITVKAADNYIYLTLPVSMSLSYGIFKTPAITSSLKFKLNARVTPDWRVNAEIYYMGLSDLLADEVGIGPISIKPRSIMEGITQPVQRVVSDAVSSRINDLFPLKSQVAKAWNAAQKPILLDKSYNAWLKITPREVMLYPLYAQNNRVKLSLGITTFAELVVGPQPPSPPLLPLPNLKLVNSFDRNFRVALNADLFYRDIVNIASPLLLNKELGSDGKSIILKYLDVYGNGDRLIIKVEAAGSVEGIFYLTCRPVFNPRTNVFSVEDVDFDMQTQSLLLQSADWLLHGTIRSSIQEKINMDMTQKLADSRAMTQKAMDQVKLLEHVFLKGNLKELRFSDVVVQQDRISIQVYAEGETAVVFQ